MIISCPHCSAVYELPGHLLGPGGAAVRCPHCSGEFTLGADGTVLAAAGVGVGATGAAEATTAHGPAAARAEAAVSARPREGATHAAEAAVSARPREGATHAAEAAVSARPREAARAPEVTHGPVAARAAARTPDAAHGPGAARAEAAPPADRGEPVTDAQAIARRVLDELAARKGSAMADANARGRLLSEFGPELIAAFDEFRSLSGGSGNPAPFRDALRERWGIDLGPPAR